MTDEKTAQVVGALLEERAAAQQKGRADLVEQINAQLRRFGHQAAPAAKRATKRA